MIFPSFIFLNFSSDEWYIEIFRRKDARSMISACGDTASNVVLCDVFKLCLLHRQCYARRRWVQRLTTIYVCLPALSMTMSSVTRSRHMLTHIIITSCAGGRHNMPRPCKLTFDLLTLKVVSESRVTWATSAVPILVFQASLYST